MHFFRIFTFCISCLCIQQFALAQGRRCATYEVGDKQAFEKWMQQEVEKRQGLRISSTTVYSIPVIFHIVHNGESAGSGYNISAAQINAQIEQLNEDFRRVGNGLNTDSRGGDSYIEFCPAAVDTNGNTLSEPGIDRINRNSKSWTAPPYGDCSGGSFDPAYIETTIKPQSMWDPTEYMNIWIMHVDCGILGYAQLPEANAGVIAELPDMAGIGGDASNDGVVLNFFTVGSVCTPYAGGAPYDLGRTATHEIGHFFGLRHIWGDAYCGTDYCGDTPTHEDFNWGVPSHPKANNCGTADEMFENYMDYSDDEAMNIFSEDQITRMRVILENSPRRASLTSSGKCSATASNPGISFVEGCNNNSVTVTEGTGNCNGSGYTTTSFTLRISREPSADVTVRLGYSGTATYGRDYLLSDTLITFSTGTDTSHTIYVYVKKDALIESNESLTLSIFSVSGGSAHKDGIRQSVSVTITNDDQAPLAAAGIHQTVDTLSGYAAFEFGPFQTIHYRDQVSGSIILSLTNTSSHDFGCTRVEVLRSGTGSNRAWTPNVAEYITSKTFRILPEFNNNTTASYDVSLFYTEAEIAGWEAATGNVRSALQIIKTSGNIAQTDPPTAPEFGFITYAAFGAAGHQYTASYGTGFSSFGMGTYSSLLPVEWVSFDANAHSDHILLNWKTASESPGTRFLIQRCTDPQNGFETIYELNGQGLINRMAEYTYRDRSAEKNILYYYRILNTDLQGKNMPTDIRSARIIGPEKSAFNIYPTFCTEYITLQGEASDCYTRRLQVSDLSGRLLIDEDLSRDQVLQSFNTFSWPNGFYIANILEDNQVVFVQKIRKQN